MIDRVLPVNAVLSVAVTMWAMPAVTELMNDTVAAPLALVVDVALEKKPPVPVLLHVTVCPAVETALL